MPTKKQLMERRATIKRDLDAIVIQVGQSGITDADGKRFTELKREFDGLSRQIADEVAKEVVETDLVMNERRDPATLPGNEDYTPRRSQPRQQPTEAEVRAEALQAWCRSGVGRGLKDRHKRACRALGVNPESRNFKMRLEKRALSVVTNTAGQYTVPTGFVASLETALLQFAAVRKVADVMVTSNGQPMPWPTANDTSNVGEQIAENTEVATADPVFSSVTLGAFKYSSKMVTVPNELLEDSAINLASWLGETLGTRIGRAQAPLLTTGSGSGEPQGIVTASTLGKTCASATAFAADEIIDLIHSIDPAYRADPSFGLMCSDAVVLVLRKMKDGNSNYLFNGGANGGFNAAAATAGPVGTFFGVPVWVNQSMSTAFTTGQKLILAGAFRKYKVRDVGTVRFRRLDERYAEKDQVGFISFLRTDAKLLDAGTHPVKHLKLA
jgi:HK97 family phage major capsid protein